jgi:large subunit ribosomal protein L4
MPTFTLYTIEGKEAGTIEQPALFQVPVDEKLIHRYFIWVRTMLRKTVAHTKTRGNVSGGGKKPWKQKGTGRARSGSNRNPIWRHGGTIFGPLKEQTWATRMPRQERRKALFSALSAKAEAGNVVVLESLVMDAPKTKAAVALVATVPGLAGKKVLHINGDYDHGIFASTRNVEKLDSVTIEEMNIVDVLNHDVLLLTKDSIRALEQHFTPTV